MTLNPIKYIRFILKIYKGWLKSKNKDHVNFFQQLKEAFTLLRLNKLEPYEYYMLELYKPSILLEEKKKYISMNQHFVFESQMNPRKEVGILNKFNFSIYAKHFGIPTPELIGLFDSKIGFTSDGNNLKTEEDLKKLFNRTNSTDLVIKPTSSGCSKGLMVCRNIGNDTIHVYGDQDYSTKEIYNILINSNYNKTPYKSDSYIIEKKVNQHKFLDNYSKSSAQSFRIITFLTSSGDVEIASTTLKIARTGNYVDNFTVNKLCSAVNEDGILGKAFEFGDLDIGDYVTWKKHPDTGYPIEGEKVPFFDESIALAKKAQSIIPFLRYIGWDITITDNGPVIFEGNYGFLIDLFQTVLGRGFLNNPFGSEVIKHNRN